MANLISLVKGFIFDKENEKSKALACYLDSKIDNSFVNYRIGMIYLDQKNWLKAEKFFLKAIKNKSSNPFFYYRLGYVLQKQDKKEEAAIQFTKALELRPNYKPWINHLNSCISNKDVIKTIKDYTDKDWASLADEHFKKAMYFRAIPYYENAINLSSKNKNYYFNLSVCYYELSQYKEAFKNITKAGSLKLQTEDYYYYLGKIYEALGDTKNSELAYQKACEKGKKDFKYGSALLDKSRSKWPEVRDQLKKFLSQKSTDDADLYYNLALACDSTYDWNEAIDALENAISLSTEPRPDWLCRLGMLYERIDDYDLAFQTYEESCKLKPNKNIFYLLGENCKKRGLYEKACTYYLQCSNTIYSFDKNIEKLKQKHLKQISNSFISWRLGRAYFNQGDFDKACENFSHCLPIPPTRPFNLPLKTFENNQDFRRRAVYANVLINEEVNPNIFFYETSLGNTFGCNPYAIFKALISDNNKSNLIHVWSINDIERVPPQYRNLNNVIFVKRGTEDYARYLGVAKYIFNSSTMPYMFTKRDGQVYINIWHGTPYKKMGRFSSSDSHLRGNVTRNLLIADYLFHDNKYSEDKLLDSYDVKELVKDKSFVTGYPRVDLTLNMTVMEKENLRQLLIGNDKRKIILFAPTWRDYESVEEQANRCLQVIKALSSRPEEYVVIFKGHNYIQDKLNLGNVHGVPKWLDTNELLAVTDVLVSDYSSITADFLVTRRPIITYMEDFELYESNRGLFISKDELPGTKCFSIEELRQIMSTELEPSNMNEWEVSISKFNDGSSTKRVLEKIFKTEQNTIAKDNSSKTSKPKILIYPGALQGNGITKVFINFINNLSSCLDIYVTIDNKIFKDKEYNNVIAQFEEKAKILPYLDSYPQTVEEAYCIGKVNKNINYTSEMFKNTVLKYYQRECKRNFGNTYFDAVINFDGYTKVFAWLLASYQNTSKKFIFCHNDLYKEYQNKYPYLDYIFRLYHDYDKVLTVCKSTGDINKNNLAYKYNIDISKFDYLNNFQDFEQIKIKSEEPLLESDQKYFNRKSSDEKIFINIGRLSLEKDQEKLIKAFSLVVETNKNVKLLIVGEGYLEIHLSKLIDNLGLQNHVFLLGYRNNPFPLLSNSDCFVLSSNHEGYPTVLIESLTLDVPIIATNIPGNNEFSEYGEIVDNSIDGIKNGIQKAINNSIRFNEFNFNEYHEVIKNKCMSLLRS